MNQIKKTKNLVLVSIGIIVLIFAVLFMTFGNTESLDVIKLEKQNLEYSFVEDGTVTASVKELVYPKISGNVEEIFVKNNQEVEKGTILFNIDKEDALNSEKVLNSKYTSLLNQVKIQESTIATAKTQYNYALDNLEKAYVLKEHGGISGQEIEDLEKVRDDAKNSLDAAEKTLKYYSSLAKEAKTESDILSKNMNKYSVLSNIAGIVAYNGLEEGMMVNPNQKVMTIYDLSTKQVESYVRTEYVNLLNVGDKVNIKVKQATGNVLYDGKIIEIGKTAEERTSSLGMKEYMIKVIAIFDEDVDNNIGMEFDVELEFFMRPIENTLAVSKASIFTDNDKKYVWCLDKGNLVKVEVTEKTKTHDMTEVEGLKEGMLIVKDASSDKIIEGNKYKANILKKK